MASILDISETFLENFVDGLSHPEHAAHPNIEFDNVEENMCEDILDLLDSLASPVFPSSAAHNVGQNFNVFGYTNWDTDDIICDIDRYIMEEEQAAQGELTTQGGKSLSDLGDINFDSSSSSGNICWNVGGGIMDLEQAAPREITSEARQNLDGLGCINYNSGWSSSNTDCNVGRGIMRPEQAAKGELTSQVVPNLRDLRFNQYDSDTRNCNINWNVGVDIMQAEQAVARETTSEACQNLDGLGCVNYDSGWSSSNIDYNVGGGFLRAEQAPVELFSQVGRSFSDLLYNNFESDTSSSNVSWNGMTHGNSLFDPLLKQKKFNSTLRELRLYRKRKNSANDSNDSVSGARALKMQHCESDVDFALANHQLEEVLSHERTTTHVDSTEQSQLDECQIQLIGKSGEIPLKNAAKGRRKQSTSHPCTECGKQFSSKPYLAIHSRIHTGEKPYKCAHCDFVCRHAGNLATHERIHSDARPFTCSTCNAAFKFRSNLNNHQRTHTAAKPFKCSTCDAAFKLRTYLACHQRTHSGKEFKCGICNQTFRRKTYLIDHKNIHTGEKPYKCSVCNETFALRSGLYWHRHKRHRKDKSSRYATFDGSQRC